jgi:hypothetical protein
MLANHPTVLGRAPTASSLGIGNVDGPNPAASTDNAIVRWDGTGGRTIQNSVLIVADTTGALSGFTSGAGITWNGGGTMTGASGSLDLAASGTNQPITLTPSGTGVVSLTQNPASTNTIATVARVTRLTTGLAANGIGGLLQLQAEDDAGAEREAAIIKWRLDSVAAASPTGSLILGTRGTQDALTINNSGIVLVGTTTDSSNGRIQLATHTTSAGGIGFGTDWSLFRTAAGGMSLVGGNAQAALTITGASGSTSFGDDATGGYIQTTGARSLRVITNGAIALTLDSSQNATFAAAVRTAAAGSIGFTGRSSITSAADGVLLFANNGATDFSRLQFGGTTSSFPALKRNSSVLETKLADDSAYAQHAADRYNYQNTDKSIRWGTGTPEGVVAAGIGSLFLRTDGGAVTTLYVKESGSGNTGWVAK